MNHAFSLALRAHCGVFIGRTVWLLVSQVYGEMYKPLDVELSIHGLGNALSNAHFTFALFVYGITPASGSFAGGNVVTLQTSPLPGDGSLGVDEFTLWWLEDAEYGISRYIAGYLGIDMGLECKILPKLRTGSSLACVMPALKSQVETDPFAVKDRPLEAFLVAEWNKNEVYSECFGGPGKCTYTYRLKDTPVVVMDLGASLLFLESAEKPGEAVDVTWGDEIVLKVDDSSRGGGAFNWSAPLELRADFGKGTFPLATRLGKAEDGNLTLRVTISEGCPPVFGAKLRLTVEPFGFGVVLGPLLTVRPVVTDVSHDLGSVGGGLEVSIKGRAVATEAASVVVGGLPCTNVVVLNTSALKCLTSSSTEKRRIGPVVVTANGVPSECRAPAKQKTVFLRPWNGTGAAPNQTVTVVRAGCEFEYSKNLTHTPTFSGVEPRASGRYPQVVTITGAGFSREGLAGNVVMLGRKQAQVLAANSTAIVCVVPKHVGGTYKLSVTVAGKGLAVGEKQFFRFESGIELVIPKVGSKYGGQKVTISGFGFAPKGMPPPFAPTPNPTLVPTHSSEGGSYGRSRGDLAPIEHDDDSDEYARLFDGWVNFGAANESSPFALDVEWATWGKMVATTHFRDERVVGDGDATYDHDLASLSIDVALPSEGFVGPKAYYAVTATDGDSGIARAFDGNPETVRALSFLRACGRACSGPFECLAAF